MKKTKFLTILFALILILALVSCGGNKNHAETDTPEKPSVTQETVMTEPPVTEPTYEKTLFNNWQEYTITYADSAADVVSTAFIQFNLKLNEKYNFTPRAESDFLIPGESAPEGTLEILIGLTNRKESIQAREALKANDYFIGMINNRLVIVGGSDKATANALEYFVSYLMKADGIYYPTDGYTYSSDYVVDSLTVGGVDISEFVIVRGNGMSTGDRNLVNHLRETVADVCGANIEITVPSSKEQTYEILIGNTGRSLTSKELAKNSYAIEQTETKLALYGNGDGSDTFVLKYLIDTLFAIPEGESYDIRLENTSGKPYSTPSLVESNLPSSFGDMRDKYAYDVISAETTLERFFAAVDELPDEVTVLEPIRLEDYPASDSKKQVYVSDANGNDNNSGTKESPYKTLGKALNTMKNQGGGVIWVEGGDYSLTEGLIINASHSGTIFSPLFIKSYGNEDVTLTSNIIIESEGFKPVNADKDKVAARLKADVKDKVFYIDLYDLGWRESDILSITTQGPARVYVDGEEFTLAQYPNAFYDDGTRTNISDLLYFKYVYDSGSVTSRDSSDLYWPWIERANADPDLTPDSVLGWEIRVINERDSLSDKGDGIMGDEILSWVNTGDIWYYGSVFEGWEHGYYNIDPGCVHGDGLLGSAKTGGFYSLKSVQPCRFGAKVSGNSAAGRNTFFLFNAIEALDAPGEWFIDRETGIFYIYPKSDDISEQLVTYSGSKSFNLITFDSASNIVLDGIGANGAALSAMRVSDSDNIIIQNAVTRNTKGSSVVFYNSKNSALLYSSLSYSYDPMVSVYNDASISSLTPMNIFIQNNTFSDTPSTVSNAVMLGGCRAIVSHNYFIDCCLNGSGIEHIIEYNRFEGGNKFVTDGGMVYASGHKSRGIHVRYNLFHMFKATHQAVYFDGMGSGMYSYCNVISTLGAQTNSHKAWYSSTGHGNVCYGNITVLRNRSQIDALEGKDTDEGTEAIKKGDEINESGLFYYYYGNNAKGNSLAGHWWMGNKESEINDYLVKYDQEAWNSLFPEYMNFLEGTKAINEAYDYIDYNVYYEPQKLSDKTHVFKTADDTVIWVPSYEYLDENGVKKTKQEQTLKAENGQIVLTFDDLAAMERLRRQPAFSVIKNNLILGGSSDPDNVVTNSAENYKGLIKDVTIKEDNYFEFDYDKIMADAENYNYNISDDVWAMLEKEMGAEFVLILKSIDYQRAGLTN
ncbi:MAG: DUF1565 domain-containing protein [Ruminococcaceae bacterium]|nr:DUF1565 domain-containing protein [Oscillospiraceae bacterium]